MGTQIDITCVIVNPAIADTQAVLKVVAVNLLGGVGADPTAPLAPDGLAAPDGPAMDSVGTVVSCTATAPGEITLAVNYQFGPKFLNMFGATDAIQDQPFVDVLRKILISELPGSLVTETRLVS